MEFEFAHFCGASPAAYDILKKQIHACARSGRSYEFSPCHMPSGCAPSSCALGFFRDAQSYVLYFRPHPIYEGNEIRLENFFSRPHRYSTFDALIADLSALMAPPLFFRLQKAFPEFVVGQEEAIEAVSLKLCGHVCKSAPRRPLSLVFYGPTGVGKSELGKQIAQVLNRCCPGRDYRLVWTELNTFTQPHSAYRLTGSPPGYVGYDDPPILEAVRSHPFTVFLFDELEKAHPEILKIFMSILDEGRCTARKEDDRGDRELDFRHCIFVFTTNAALGAPPHPLGFSLPSAPRPASSPASAARRVFDHDEQARQAMVRSGVLKEIAGRFSGLIGFRELEPSDREKVTVLQISALGREYGLSIRSVSPDLSAALTPAEGFSVRSTAGMLESLLTPLLLSHSHSTPSSLPLLLTGTPSHPRLLPLTPHHAEGSPK